MKKFKKILKLTIALASLALIISTSSTKVEANQNITNFIDRMYRVALNRKPEAKGMSYWQKGLTNKTLSAAEFVSGVLLSNEMYKRDLDENQFIDICYKACFDRNPDNAGKGYWIVLAQNHKREYIVNGFIQSQEFANVCKKYGMNVDKLPSVNNKTYGLSIKPINMKFNCLEGLSSLIEDNYYHVLGRKADTGGLKYWIDRISTGKQDVASALAEGFLHSNEFLSLKTSGTKRIWDPTKKYRTNEEFIRILYRNFLQREPEENGFKYWHDLLKTGTMTRDQVITGFANSAEFKNKVKSSATKACEGGKGTASAGNNQPMPTATPKPSPSPSPTPKPTHIHDFKPIYETKKVPKEREYIYHTYQCPCGATFNTIEEAQAHVEATLNEMVPGMNITFREALWSNDDDIFFTALNYYPHMGSLMTNDHVGYETYYVEEQVLDHYECSCGAKKQ